MANSFVRYTGDNSTTAYSIPFSYRATGDLTVTISGSATTAFTLNAAGTTLTFNSAPAQDAAIEIRRRTSQTTKLVDYASGSVLTENDLDTDSDQAFFMGQEAIDDANDVIKISNTDFQWDATNKRLTNVADPTSAQDAATKNYLENTWLSSANKTALTTVNSNISNINAVNSNASNINSAVSNATNINTVATNIGSVNTVATDITKVIAVANDLAEAVSEVETVADDLNETTSEIDTVANAITNVDNVGNNIANVNSVAGNSTNINAVAGNATNINAVNLNSSNINTVAGDSTEINSVAGIASDVTSVAGIASNVTSVAGISTAVTAVNNNSTNINAVNSNSSNINAVAGMSTAINTVNSSATAINNVNSNATNINAVANDISNINTVAGANNNISTVVSNLASVNNFGEVYRVSSSAPTSSLNSGDLWFDSQNNILKVYGASGFQSAGSSVNGTSVRIKYVATANQTTFTGADANGETLAYDPLYLDVYLNGVHLDPTDYTATNGTSVVLATGANVGDILYIVAFGTFNISTVAGSAITSGTINEARLPTVPTTKGGTGLTSLGNAGQALVVNQAGNALEYSNASSAEVYGFEKYYNPSTLVKTVTDSGGKYYIDGVQQDTLELYEGNTYIFNHPSSHPFRFSTDSNNSNAYTTGVTVNSSTQVTIVVASGAPTLYYYCSSHSNMGGQANTPTPANNAVRYITTNQGQDDITESQYANFDDVLFSASGFVFSINTNGNLISTI